MVNCQRKLACKIRRLAFHLAIPRVVYKVCQMKIHPQRNSRDPRWVLRRTAEPARCCLDSCWPSACQTVSLSSQRQLRRSFRRSWPGRGKYSMEKCCRASKWHIRTQQHTVSCENCRAKTSSAGFASFGNFAESFQFESAGKEYDLFDYLADNRVAGLLILKNGKVVFEDYELGTGPETAGRHSRWPSLCRPRWLA